MNALLVLLFATFTATAHAHHIEGHEMPNFEACENVTIAVLNKDNRPYWAPTPQTQEDNIARCYQDLKIFSQKATPKMINRFVEEYEGQIQIFNDDIEFASFIQANQPDFTPDVQTTTPVVFESKITVLTPSQPAQLFNGLFKTH